MNLLLIHNHSAGGGGTSADDLRGAFAEAGFDPIYRTKKDGVIGAELLNGVDLVVIAGGDGTVASLLEETIGADVRFSIVPLGTANNVATSLGITGSESDIARGLRRGAERALDLGIVEGLGERRLFVEAVGVGAVAAGLAASKEDDLSGEQKFSAGRDALADVLRRGAGQTCSVAVDGVALPEELSLVEILNIPVTGPGLALSPSAEPGDGLLDVVYLRRAGIGAFLQAMEAGAPLPLDLVRGRTVELTWCDEPLRVDDDFPQPPGARRRVSVTLSDTPARVIVPAKPDTGEAT